jgi:uncharacterized protein YegP (UPF0339 family)
MAGMFELFVDAEDSFRFQLTAPDGTVMAVSRPFPSKAAAVEGIAAVRPLSMRMPLQCQRMAG